MSQPFFSFTEPITEPDILESIKALPTEDDLPCDDGEPMETARHRDQMGEVVPTPTELWEQERQRAEQERQRAEQAEQRLEAYRRRFGSLE